jgi:C_GCAxxG_C_C family probable redox protein
MIDTVAENSRAHFNAGFYCAESVLLAIAEGYGIESNLIPKIATGFCSGLARTCGLCGAVSGGVLGLNLLTGRTDAESPVDENYALVSRFVDEFEARFSSTNCWQLTGCDLGTEEGKARFRADGVFARCEVFVEEATRICMRLLAEVQQAEVQQAEVQQAAEEAAGTDVNAAAAQ